MRERQTRREWILKGASVAAAGYVAQSSLLRAARAIAAPVAITRCKTYDPGELVPTLNKLFDLLGGLGGAAGGAGGPPSGGGAPPSGGGGRPGG